MSEAGGLRRASYGGAGAGEGNRTLVVSLGSFCSTIELHPHFNDLAALNSHFLQWFLQQRSKAPPLPRSVALVNGDEAMQCELLMAGGKSRALRATFPPIIKRGEINLIRYSFDMFCRAPAA